MDQAFWRASIILIIQCGVFVWKFWNSHIHYIGMLYGKKGAPLEINNPMCTLLSIKWVENSYDSNILIIQLTLNEKSVDFIWIWNGTQNTVPKF